ncbi:MAG: uracil phosphoribosyltransferase [Bacteroidales bacterium]|nr:uracil phosphoribosyltransferase [Bacteroidales bacterium]
MVNILGTQNSVFNQYISEIRDVEIQGDRLRFRKNLERIGEIFAYEISKKLEYEMKEVITSLGSVEVSVLKHTPVLATILRSGLPFHQGMLNFFDHSESAFISAYRKIPKNKKFNIKIEYSSSPSLTDKVLILSDPMLATGASAVATYKELLKYGKPVHTHIVAILSSVEGVEYIKRHFSKSEISIWVGVIDDELTAQAYIVPGLGDAGDLAYGNKM